MRAESPPSADKILAERIHEAIASAEKHHKHEGFSLYPFLWGHLLGNLPESQIDAFNARVDALYSANGDTNGR